MSFSVYEATIPPMIHFFENLSKILDKAVSQAKERDLPLSELLEARLAPDMHPFPRQIQIASDIAKLGAARLTGTDAPSFPDTESTFPELQDRIRKTVDYLKSVPQEKFEGAEDRICVLKFPQGEMSFPGRVFLSNFVLPNFYFHVTTAYDLLRHKGIAIGKGDYMGAQ
jgi:hypothetical protein